MMYNLEGFGGVGGARDSRRSPTLKGAPGGMGYPGRVYPRSISPIRLNSYGWEVYPVAGQTLLFSKSYKVHMAYVHVKQHIPLGM